MKTYLAKHTDGQDYTRVWLVEAKSSKKAFKLVRNLGLVPYSPKSQWNFKELILSSTYAVYVGASKYGLEI